MISMRCTRLLNSKEDLINYPNILEDFFSLVKRIIELREQIFIDSQQLESIIALIVRSIGLDHPEAAKSHSRLLIDMLYLLRYKMKSY